MSDSLEESALLYHSIKPAGKLTITATKPLANQVDLSQAYSPGVAFPCHRIHKNPLDAAIYTARSNLVGVITNGSAVLGLGDIGPLAAKPVMEGKAVLFKKFANIDAFDIEVDETDPEKFVEAISKLEPTFGAINLEDIKAPDCFVIESALRERMNIPVFHDDQHGTAIVVAAAIKNGLEVVGKQLADIKLVSTGGGAASLSCLDLLVELGLPREHVTLVDLHGVVYAGRTKDMNDYKARFAKATNLRNLDEAIVDADVFLGLSGPNALSADMVKKMAADPLILALANPTPEILPEVALEARLDAIIATGRSDYPNQVNNVLCFPFIFRGALDVGATTINKAMKAACVDAIAGITKRESTDEVASVYKDEKLQFGPTYLIPKPFDARLYVDVSFAVAKAAMDSGVALRPIEDLQRYKEKLRTFSNRSLMFMQPVIDVARRDRERLAYAEGENETVLRTVQAVVREGIAEPIVIGREDVVASRLRRLGIELKAGDDFQLVDPENDARYEEYWKFYHSVVCRRGVSVAAAQTVMRTNNTAIAACMVAKEDADAMICGTEGRFDHHLQHIIEVIGTDRPNENISSLAVLVLPQGPIFITDAHIGVDPSVEQIANTTIASAKRVSDFGIKPKVALLSHSNFGSSRAPSAIKMRKATELLRRNTSGLEVDGEMHADAALNGAIRDALNQDSHLDEAANLLVMPNLDAANIAVELIRSVTDALMIGPILSGTAKSAHIVTSSSTVKGVFNMSAIAVADCWRRHNAVAQSNLAVRQTL
ncbi:MAG: NADP-dependent malic enzyme [Gammaproteobacteria bacterium]|nr:NADP-dependent malic enzyme [Gammaproteobacteria bacterium]